ncbi:MAG: gliding motility-associated C-terminal domain-containing protein [Bacteroidetes bacterium]|nr:gliding motility-associated C-terminal domain-containing protein [Bacteroidota bacterium]MDA1121225.1 gliding motility-associated C-terminal domain-containing protein [Bacteroidota bacterium]
MLSIFFRRLLIFSFFAAPLSAFGQFDSLFWFAAPDAAATHEESPVRFRVSTADQPAIVIIDQPANPNFPSVTYTMTANETRTYTINNVSLVENLIPDLVQNKGLRVRSTALITCYYEIGQLFNVEYFALKGRNALGQDFVIPGQNFWNITYELAYKSFDIVATEDNTIITIIPSTAIDGHSANASYKIKMNRGQTYSARALSLSSSETLTGSQVTSSQPIAITIKDDSLNDDVCHDIAGDQIVPVGVVGHEYIIGKSGTITSEKAFITATEDGTDIFINGNLVTTMNRLQVFPIAVSGNMYIRGSKPIYLMQYTGIGCEIGAALIPSINCKGSTQVSFTRSSDEGFWLNLLVRSSGIDKFVLNGNPNVIVPGMFTTVPGTDGQWYRAGIPMSNNLISVGSANIITNNTNSFQLGIVDGGERSGTRFGYFSNFSSLFIGDDIVLCEGESRTIYPKADPGASLLWSDGSSGPSLEVSQPGKYWVQAINDTGCTLLTDTVVQADNIVLIFITNGDCCVLKDTLEVTFQQKNFKLDSIKSACLGDDVLLDAGDAFSYIWSTGETTQQIKVQQPGNYTVEIIDNNGCIESDEVEVNFIDPPNINLGNNVTICSGDAYEIDVGPIAYSSIKWQDGSTQPIFNATFEGIYWVDVTLNSCTVRDSMEISFFPTHENAITGSRSVCPGAVEVDYSAVEFANSSYQWFSDGGAVASDQGTSEIKINWDQTNPNAQVKLIEIDEYGCTNDTLFFDVRVNVMLDTEKPLGDLKVCENDKESVMYSTQGTNGSIYTWNASGGNIASGQGSNEVLVDWFNTGIHSIYVTESSTTADTVCFGISDPLPVEVFKDSLSIKMRYVTVNQSGEGIELSWEIENTNRGNGMLNIWRTPLGVDNWEILISLESITANFVDETSIPEETSYQYQISLKNQCEQRLESSIHNSILLTGIGNEEAGVVSLNWNSYIGWENGVSAYEIWRQLDDQENFELVAVVPPEQNEISFENAGDGFVHVLKVKATSLDAPFESWSNELNIKFEHKITIPNVITPNSDGLNDQFKIAKVHLYPKNELVISNRYGKEVFRKTGYLNEWNASGLESGTYYYSFFVSNLNQEFNGTVTVLR